MIVAEFTLFILQQRETKPSNRANREAFDVKAAGMPNTSLQERERNFQGWPALTRKREREQTRRQTEA
jgi:hypothetical protein